MSLCIDFSEQLLAMRIGIGNILQIDGENFVFKLRSCFHPDPLKFSDPRTGNPPFQRDSDFLVAVL
jgi:hypothetical protein